MNKNSMSEDAAELIPAPPPPEGGKNTPRVKTGGRGGRSVQPPETEAIASQDPAEVHMASIDKIAGLEPARAQQLKDAVDGLQEEFKKEKPDQDRIDFLRGQLEGEDVPASVKSLVESMFPSDESADTAGEHEDDGVDGDPALPQNREQEEILLQEQQEEAIKAIREAQKQGDDAAVDAAVAKFVKFGKGLKFLGHAVWITAVAMILMYILTNKLVAK